MTRIITMASVSRSVRRFALMGAAVAFSAVVLLAPRVAEAVPTLQLYLPDGEYADSRTIGGVTVTQSWLTLSTPFDLVVAGATSPNKVATITDVALWISIQEADFNNAPNDSTVSVTLEGSSIPLVLGKSNASYGTPSLLAPHGIFPAYYFQVGLPDLDVAGAGETVYDYNTDFDPANPGASASDSGDQQTLNIDYSAEFFYLHMDLTGTALDADGNVLKTAFSPYSHDADAPPRVPEPGTLAVFATGLFILAAAARRRRRTVITAG